MKKINECDSFGVQKLTWVVVLRVLKIQVGMWSNEVD